MFISYENNEIRDCCFLLRPASVNTIFTTDEIKEIRAIIADLRAAPKLIDSPINYNIDKELGVINILYGNFKIICKIISTYKNPTVDKIERIKILNIVNVELQLDITKKHNYK